MLYFEILYFFDFFNPNTISLNLNYLYHLEIDKIKPFQNEVMKYLSKQPIN